MLNTVEDFRGRDAMINEENKVKMFHRKGNLVLSSK